MMTERERTDFAGMSLMQDESIHGKIKEDVCSATKVTTTSKAELFTESEDFRSSESEKWKITAHDIMTLTMMNGSKFCRVGRFSGE